MVMTKHITKKKPVNKKGSSSGKIKNRAKNIHKMVKKVPRKLFRKATIFAVLLVVVLALYFTVGLQVKILIAEEMNLDLSPAEKSFTVSYDSPPNITFNLFVDNPVTCSFTCVHELKDIGSNVTLSSDITSDDDVSMTYTLPLDLRGEGQKLFNYKVSCHNIKTSLCHTNQAEYVKSALLTVNYHLPSAEELQKEFLEDDFSYYLQLVEDCKSISFYNQQLAKILDVSVNASLNNLVRKESLHASSLNDLWNSFYYYELYSDFSKISISEIVKLKSDLLKEQNYLIQTTTVFNEGLSLVRNISNISYFQDAFLVFNTSDAVLVNSLISELNKTISVLNYRSFTSYDSLSLDLLLLKTHYESIDKDYLVKKNMLIEQINESRSKYNYYFSQLNRSSFISEKINCSSVDSLNLVIDFENLKANNTFESNFSALSPTIQSKISNVYVSWLNKKFKGIDADLDLTLFEQISSANTSINFSNLDPGLLKSIILLPDLYFSYCSSDTKNISIIPLSSQDLFIPPISDLKNISLKDNSDICCFDGDCSTCCTADSCKDNYPVMFVHGHAISKGNLPEESHESFALMQRLLESDGYVNAGEIGEGSEFLIPEGDWGRMIEPITVRVSYYYISYLDLGSYKVRTQRTDSIENYAIRLKELIDLIKYRTGKDKVDIVAHSMGGLVVREYIALFGEDDINKFVMLGTPNKGIEGRVKRLCSVTGASRECTEMGADSVFMKRLDVSKNIFQDIKGYTITATGCDMDGEDGDGIVLARNVALNYTTNLKIEGNCTDVLESNLHTRFINPNYYPETFDMLRSILLN